MLFLHYEEREIIVFHTQSKESQEVKTLQECCAFLSDEDFINALEYNAIKGVDFGRRDVKIANEIYGHSKGAAMDKFKHPRKEVKMDRTTEHIATHVPPKIVEHYKNIHLNIDLLFVNKILFLLAKSRDIGFIHCEALLSKHDKRVQKVLKSTVLD